MLRSLLLALLSAAAFPGSVYKLCAQENQSKDGAILGNIPYVGMLFRADNDQNSFRQRQQMVLPLIDDIEECPSPPFKNQSNTPTPQCDQPAVVEDLRPPRHSNVAQAVFNHQADHSGEMTQMPQSAAEFSDAILAEFLTNTELDDQMRAKLIMKILTSIRRQARDEAFAELLEDQNHQARVQMPMPMSSAQHDPYFTPARADLQRGDPAELQEILVRLEQQQLLLQNQVRQMQEWHGFLGNALRDIQDQITRLNTPRAIERPPMTHTVDSSNSFRLPSYSRENLSDQHSGNPIPNSLAAADQKPTPYPIQLANELAYLESLQEKIRQRQEAIGRLYPSQPSNHYAFPPEPRTSTPGSGPLLPR